MSILDRFRRKPRLQRQQITIIVADDASPETIAFWQQGGFRVVTDSGSDRELQRRFERMCGERQ